MACACCGGELTPDKIQCPHCGHHVSEVKVLSQKERDNFHGVTLGEENFSEAEREFSQQQRHERIYVRQVSFGGGVLSRLMLGALLAFLALLVLLFLRRCRLSCWFYRLLERFFITFSEEDNRKKWAC